MSTPNTKYTTLNNSYIKFVLFCWQSTQNLEQSSVETGKKKKQGAFGRWRMQGDFSRETAALCLPELNNMCCKACFAATWKRWVLWHRPQDHHMAWARPLCSSLGARPQSRQEVRLTFRLLCISLGTVSLLSGNNYSRVLVQLIVKRSKNMGTPEPAHWTQIQAWNSRAKQESFWKVFGLQRNKQKRYFLTSSCLFYFQRYNSRIDTHLPLFLCISIS